MKRPIHTLLALLSVLCLSLPAQAGFDEIKGSGLDIAATATFQRAWKNREVMSQDLTPFAWKRPSQKRPVTWSSALARRAMVALSTRMNQETSISRAR